MKNDTNTPIASSKWPPKWAEEQDFWAKLGFREWVVTLVKKCKWHKYSFNRKLLVACYSGKEIIVILWLNFEIFIIEKCQKLLFCRHFCKDCFFFSSLIPAKCLYVSRISVAKHSTKRVISRVLRSFGYKIKDFYDFLMNGS